MRRDGAIWSVMPRAKLDTHTADRMLDRAVGPRDVPPGYGAVAELLHAVAEPAAGATAGSPARRRPAERSMIAAAPARLRRPTVAMVAACMLATGTAAYAAGVPQVASHAASGLLSKLAAPNSTAAAHHPGNHGGDVSAVAHDRSPTGRAHGAAVSAVARSKRHARPHPGASRKHSAGSASEGKGTRISSLAHSTPARGGKGTVVSTAASGGHSQAGRHGRGTAPSSGASANGGSRQTAHGGHAGGSGTTAR